MDSEPGNPYRSPREDGRREQAPDVGAPKPRVENLIWAFIHAGGLLFSLFFFTFFACGAIDFLRPPSIIESRLGTGPPMSYELRVAGCATFTLLAIPFLAIMVYLAWNLAKLFRKWRTQRRPNGLLNGVRAATREP